MSTASKEVPAQPAPSTPHIRSGERKIVFCYDIACPFSYVASRLIDKLAHEYHAKLEWWPVLLSGLHTLDDTPRDAEPPVKQRYLQRDLLRQAARLNVPLRLSALQHDSSSLSAMHAIAAVQGDERVKLTHELFKRRWVKEEDIASEAVIAAAIKACAIDPTHINRAKGTDALGQSTQHAHDMGAPGTPTFFVYAAAPVSNRSAASADVFFAPTMLYGLDRMHFVRHALGDEAGQVERVTTDPALLVGHKPQVELFLDLASPYSFLAFTQLSRLQHLCDVTLTLIHIGGLLKALHAKAPLDRLGENRKRQYQTDLQDWAEWWHEKCVVPPFFPVNCMMADRCVLVEPRLMEPLLRALWQRSLNISERPRLLQLIGEAGINADDVWQRSQAAEVKERLKANGERALAMGVFGVPTFVYEGELLFGQDRMDVLMDRLSGWKAGKNDDSSGGKEGASTTNASGENADDGRGGRSTPLQRNGKETETVAENEKRAKSSSKQPLNSKL